MGIQPLNVSNILLAQKPTIEITTLAVIHHRKRITRCEPERVSIVNKKFSNHSVLTRSAFNWFIAQVARIAKMLMCQAKSMAKFMHRDRFNSRFAIWKLRGY